VCTSVEQGHAEAQFTLGNRYETGKGVKVDKAKGAQLIGRAAEQGHALAQCKLGLCYHLGEGILARA
jgi:TPR repeat protein